MKKVFLYLGAALLAAAALTSCNKDFTAAVSPDGLNGPEIAIRTNSAMTKSAMSGTAFPQGYDMLVSAYRNLGSHPGADAAASYFEGIQFGYDGVSGSWKSEKGAKYYPLDGTLDFLAVASAGINTSGTGIVPTAVWGESSNVAKKVVLTVPDNSAKFDDLMYASANAQSLSASGTAMTFHHAMSSVVFTAKCNVAYSAGTNVGITIDGITVDGAKYSGTLTVSNPSAGGGSGDLSAEWSSLSSAQAHIAARVWNASNTGILTNESALSALNLTATAMTVNASYPFGEAYVILPPQDAVPFTVTYTIHNGFASDGSTPLNKQVQYQYSPSGSWDMNKKNVYEIDFNLTEILVNPSIVDWDAVDAELVPVPAPTIAGLTIAAGPLFYNGTSYEIKDSWNYDSYESVYGKASGSYYFNFIEMGQLFEKADFSSSDDNIENLLNPLSGWRLPTKAEWRAIVGTTRAGSTVNGNAGKHYALVQLTGVTHAGSSTPNGLLIFPDNKTITGKALSGMDNGTQTTSVTASELNAYLEQGCVFLPASGLYLDGDGWYDGGNYGFYWSSTEYDEDYAYYLGFDDSYVVPGNYDYKSGSYYPVRLVRE